MEKTKTFESTRFSPEVLRAAVAELERLHKGITNSLTFRTLAVGQEEAEWEYDKFEEFLADFRKAHSRSTMSAYVGAAGLVVWTHPTYTRINVKSFGRANIETVFSVFEAAREKCSLPIPEKSQKDVVVFVGHGHSSQWRDLKDHLQEKHGYKVEAYETGARAGHSIRDILEEMIDKSSFAVLVMTAEDEQADGSFRARQNVVHEAGLFQGRLGFSRAILLIEDGVDQFSNVQGVQYLRFSKENIKEVFGDVLATIRREFLV